MPPQKVAGRGCSALALHLQFPAMDLLTNMTPVLLRSLVEASIPRISRPVAIGSRVPACPTFLVPASLRTRETTSWLVIPPGLSTSRMPEVLTRPRSLLVPEAD